MTDFYGGKDPADVITYSHKFVEKLTGLRPRGQQLTFREVYSQALYSANLKAKLLSCCFDKKDLYLLWKDSVRIDPKINFGKPCIRGSGIKTSVIYARYKNGESVTEIAEDYDIAEAAVKAAIEFEEVIG